MSEERSDKPVEEVFRQKRVSAVGLGDPPTVAATLPMAETLSRLRLGTESFGGGYVVVVEESEKGPRPIGLFTERDYLDKVALIEADARAEMLAAPVANYMTANPVAVGEADDLNTAINAMTAGGYRHMPFVTSDGVLAGVISVRDVISYLAEFFPVDVMNLPPRLTQDELIRAREGE